MTSLRNSIPLAIAKVFTVLLNGILIFGGFISITKYQLSLAEYAIQAVIVLLAIISLYALSRNSEPWAKRTALIYSIVFAVIMCLGAILTLFQPSEHMLTRFFAFLTIGLIFAFAAYAYQQLLKAGPKSGA